MLDNNLFFLKHSPIDFVFNKTADNFVVKEHALYEPSGTGEHLWLYLRKKDLSTPDLLKALSSTLGVKIKDIGYAGLKDQDALTYQHLTLPKQYESSLASFDHPKIKILSINKHKNKLKTGHLKGNEFFVRLKKVSPTNAMKIQQALKQLADFGMPNFFGKQRFATRNLEKAANIAKMKNHYERSFLINVLQSVNFNRWLNARLSFSLVLEAVDEWQDFQNLEFLDIDFAATNLSPKDFKNQAHPFKIIPGDICMHYPHGRLFLVENLNEESQRFKQQSIVPTGLLPGKKVMQAEHFAKTFEQAFEHERLAYGARRFAFVFPQIIDSIYKQDQWHFEFSFYLPKGSYATVFLEQIAKRDL